MLFLHAFIGKACFNCMNNTSSLKSYTVFHRPTFSMHHKSVTWVIAARLDFLHKVSWVKSNFSINLMITH